MSAEFAALSNTLAGILVEPATRGRDGAIAWRLRLPELSVGRKFSFAELILPRGFPEQAIARIRLSSDAVLRVPHVEYNGLLCIDGDPGPGRGLDGTQRVQTLLHKFYKEFLDPWSDGELDGDFAKEPQNYWTVNVAKLQTDADTARVVWTVDDVPRKAQVREGLLLLPTRLIVAGDGDNQFVQRIVASLGYQAKQRVRVIIADIPISHSFVPGTWPKNVDALVRVLRARLKPAEYRRFLEQSLRKRRSREHRVALFRNHEGGFAFVLPGGPPTIHIEANRHRARHSRSTIQPLLVDRVDPDWTVGRDQISQVSVRQQKHVVVFGAGALGSPVVEQLAKGGVGRITLVDFDTMESANLGRHLLGIQHVGYEKAAAVAEEVKRSYPSCRITPYIGTAERWLRSNVLNGVDAVLDLTGEPEVRWHLNEARRKHPCPLIVGWMEPFVAAAHVCLLTPETLWFSDQASTEDRLKLLEAVDWPEDVIRQVPGCSSRFQAYTSANAAYAVALVSENALRVVDGEEDSSKVLSWVRGRQFLDKHWPTLRYRDWAADAAQHVGVTKERPFI
ncbi:ThiF family adenylyltransferase [Chromobacterium violaceum]|uniref:HesA/MoeB/ThiF family protein n=1 Tax=Chromobacterium violaceum TaxID=536 RepID=UPI001B336728|nr:ThiF family adenylyltransferase [Chromobacterium violaceum]MBP4049367.1 ThiF family adenylyltransferase [Chromobacterium violaceum]